MCVLVGMIMDGAPHNRKSGTLMVTAMTIKNNERGGDKDGDQQH